MRRSLLPVSTLLLLGAAYVHTQSQPRSVRQIAPGVYTRFGDRDARAFEPVVSLLERLLDDATAAAALRSGLSTRSVAGVTLQAIMFNAFAATISGTPIGPDGNEEAEQLWFLFIHGIGSHGAA